MRVVQFKLSISPADDYSAIILHHTWTENFPEEREALKKSACDPISVLNIGYQNALNEVKYIHL